MPLLFSSRMPPKRPEDIHRSNSSRPSDGKGEASRHGSMGGSRRNPKLDVSYLLNQGSGSSTGGSADSPVSRSPSQGSASRLRQEKRSPASTGSGQRRFRCESCNATFAQSHDALKHRRFVENSSPLFHSPFSKQHPNSNL